MNRKILFLVMSALLLSCDSVSQSAAGNFLFEYDLSLPSEKYSLPVELSEVSGLAYHNGKLLCIQDESADIFVFDPVVRKVTVKYSSKKQGDFEDIAVIGSTAYLLKSSGTLVEVHDFSGGKSLFTEIETPLSPKNDTEGLAYDPVNEYLLISCKEYPDLKDENRFRGTRAIYRFSLRGNLLDEDPYITINLKTPDGFARQELFDKFLAFGKLRPEISAFKPSGIAIHPTTNEIYVISASGRLILALDSGMKVKQFGYLPPEIFSQPEGICFSPDGDLFISNEGKGTMANILRFTKAK